MKESQYLQTGWVFYAVDDLDQPSLFYRLNKKEENDKIYTCAETFVIQCLYRLFWDVTCAECWVILYSQVIINVLVKMLTDIFMYMRAGLDVTASLCAYIVLLWVRTNWSIWTLFSPDSDGTWLLPFCRRTGCFQGTRSSDRTLSQF